MIFESYLQSIRLDMSFCLLAPYGQKALTEASTEIESITEDRMLSNLSKTKNILPKAVVFSDFKFTFAKSLISVALICSTKVTEIFGMAKSKATFC